MAKICHNKRLRSVMLITVGFPPEGGGGSLRATKLVKYLSRHEWHPIVLTARPPRLIQVECDSMDSHITIYRAPRNNITVWFANIKNGCQKMLKDIVLRENENPKSPNKSVSDRKTIQPRRRLSEYILFPDERIAWIPGAVIFGIIASVKETPQVLYSMSPTPSSHLVGYFLHKITRLPWIVEFRDPWMTNNKFRFPRPFKWMERFESWMEKVILYRANHIVVTSQQYKQDLLQRYSGLTEYDISYVPNGFDPGDFENVKPMKFDKLTIVHAGNFYAARSSTPFLEALQMFITNQPNIRGKIQVLFVGQKDVNSQIMVDELRLNDIVHQIGSVSHSKSIAHMLGADILLLIPGPGDGTMPGKTYEYLAARKPILAIADKGAVRDFVTTTGIGRVVSPKDTQGIEKSLSEMYKLITTQGYPYPDVSDVCITYDRNQIASKIANLLNKVACSKISRPEVSI